LEEFIKSEGYDIIEYENTNYPNSPLYVEIKPYPNSTFSVPASGVLENSPLASHALDRLVAVSGSNQGWHVFGEDSHAIENKVNNGDLNKK